jgi:hypothetical protein
LGLSTGLWPIHPRMKKPGEALLGWSGEEPFAAIARPKIEYRVELVPRRLIHSARAGCSRS